MSFANSPSSETVVNKRIKISENEEVEVTSDHVVNIQEIPNFVVLDDSNSVKLKKGNLVIRKYDDKQDYTEIDHYTNTKGYEILDMNRKPGKSVKYLPDEAIERVKFFQKDAQPNAPELTIDEVIEIQRKIEHELRSEESKVPLKFSQEQNKRDGVSKEYINHINSMKKVRLSL